ncbi:replication-relaxation family protein [Paenibacillus antarcticus]|nr:replication-relaxation family protein [Paenibacillus antarcticus]
MKKDSQKINHFLLIAQFYKDVRKSSIPKEFIVEPKYGSKFMEPDIFMIWKGTPFFVEVQRTVYTDKVMKAKIDRYELYFNSGEWQREPWQPKDKKVFPYIWIIGVGKYSTGIRPFRVIQNSVEEMLKQVK